MGFLQSIHLVEVSCACRLPFALSSDAAMQFSHQSTPSLQEELSLAGMQQFANDVLEIGSRSFDIHAANVIKRCTRQDVRYLVILHNRESMGVISYLVYGVYLVIRFLYHH